MHYGDGQPTSRKKTARVLVGVTLLAWATQLLLQQWGYGQTLPNQAVPAVTDAAPAGGAVPDAAGDLPAAAPADQPADPMDTAAAATLAAIPSEPTEHFVETRQSSPSLELRAQATIIGDEVHVKQVCRWRDEHRAALAPVADLVVAHIPPGKVFVVVTMEQLRQTFAGAGVNVAPIQFTGVRSCTVSRSDLPSADPDTLDEWTRQSNIAPAGGGALAVSAADQSGDAPAGGTRTLRQALLEDLSARTGIPTDQFQLDFQPQDLHLLNLSEPMFHFRIDGTFTKQLGDIHWGVEVASKTGAQHLTISATVRAWQNQVVIARPLATHQVIRDEDVVEKRSLVDHLDGDPMLARPQIVGQQAGYELRPGAAVTSRMVEPLEYVKQGQLVTVTLNVGGVSVTTAGRAMEAGSYGQCINVRNEETHDMYQVTITGPQAGLMTPTASQTAAQIPAEPVALGAAAAQ